MKDIFEAMKMDSKSSPSSILVDGGMTASQVFWKELFIIILELALKNNVNVFFGLVNFVDILVFSLDLII